MIYSDMQQERPKFESGLTISGAVVISDKDGYLHRVDAETGTMKQVDWEPRPSCFEQPSLPQKLRRFVDDSRLAQGGSMERLEALHIVLADCGLRIVEASR